MAALLTASLVLALLVFSSNGQRNITAKPGDNVTITCEPENKYVSAVQWNRTDVDPDRCVLLYRDKRIDDYDNHCSSFKDRVELLEIKKGNASFVLKNVMTNDTGTYECWIINEGNNRNKRSVQENNPTTKIDLIVKQGNNEDGRNRTGLIVGLSVCTLVALLVAAVLYKRSRGTSRNSKVLQLIFMQR